MKKANDFTAMETIFAISDNPASEEYGTTCFGQDVAAYTEIVTVMVGNTIFLKHFFVGFSFSFHWNFDFSGMVKKFFTLYSILMN